MPFDAEPQEHTSATSPTVTLFGSLTHFLGSLVGLLQTRLELLTTELQEEIQRAAQMVALAFVAMVAAMMGLFMLGMTIVIFFWDTHRELAAVIVTFCFFAIAAVAALTLAIKSRSRPPLLQATLSELKKDADQLREHS